jgi:hypothetical protein
MLNLQQSLLTRTEQPRADLIHRPADFRLPATGGGSMVRHARHRLDRRRIDLRAERLLRAFFLTFSLTRGDTAPSTQRDIGQRLIGG